MTEGQNAQPMICGVTLFILEMLKASKNEGMLTYHVEEVDMIIRETEKMPYWVSRQFENGMEFRIPGTDEEIPYNITFKDNRALGFISPSSFIDITDNAIILRKSGMPEVSWQMLCEDTYVGNQLSKFVTIKGYDVNKIHASKVKDVIVSNSEIILKLDRKLHSLDKVKNVLLGT